jgi:hypothetical protein
MFTAGTEQLQNCPEIRKMWRVASLGSPISPTATYCFQLFYQDRDNFGYRLGWLTTIANSDILFSTILPKSRYLILANDLGAE